MRDFLLEVGCENLPPHAIRSAFEQLRRDAATQLDALRLPYGKIYTTGSPRRLVLIVHGLADVQSAQAETVTGPPVDRAFDEAGRPTRAAEGFARSHGFDPAKLKTVETDRGEFVGFTRTLKRRRASVLLKNLVPELIAGLRWPKLMHWQPASPETARSGGKNDGFRFARPIRWIVCMLGSTILRFSIAGVHTGNKSYTTPWIHTKPVTIRSPKTYMSSMKKAGIIVDHEDRARRIESLAKQAAKHAGLQLIEDPGLIDELTFMLESPSPLTGEFDKRYLKLPQAVVVTAMKSHQRYLAFQRRGKLVPRFLTLTEGKVGSPATVRHGNETVLRARLEDATFYWEEDNRTGVDGLAEKLKKIVFIEKLGTLADKSTRVSKLAEIALEMSGADGVDKQQVDRASHIAKADLASEMIKDGKEFTLLQGLIGSCYASESGEDPEIITAILEQYMPRSPGDGLPTTELGTALSIADRIDTITGCFLAALVPTGSQDPYALRRQANGLLRLLEARPGVSIRRLLEVALDGYIDGGFANADRRSDAFDRLIDFFQSRMALYLKDRGIDYDIVSAVTAVAWENPGVAWERARVIQSLRGDIAFELLVTGAKRVSNILDDSMKRFGLEWPELEAAFQGSGELAPGVRIDPDGFEEASEKALYQEIRSAVPTLRERDSARDEKAILSALSGLGPAIDRFFDDVLVNSPDADVRLRRHHFLAGVFAIFAKYADLSHIVESGSQPPE